MTVTKEAAGDDYAERLARLEEALGSLATKADIEGVKALLAQREAVMLRWLMGMVAAAGLAVAIALVRTFVT